MELLELGKTPISQDSPCGADVRYEPEYEDLQSEIEKLTSPTSSGGIDWERVIKLSSDILAENSKHLLVASYLFVALVHSKGIEGFGTGLTIYRDLLDNFWDNLFPPKKRMRARNNALQWCKETLILVVESLPLDSVLTEEKVNALKVDLDAIDAFLGEHMDDPPSFYQLQNIIAAKQPPAEPEEDEVKEQQPGPEAESAAGKTPEIAGQPEEEAENLSGQDHQKILNMGLENFRRASALCMQNDPSGPLAYRLTRIAAWLPVEKLPPAQDGKTRILPPMPEIKKAIVNLYQQGNFKGLLESAEARVGQFLFWLDLSRYVAEALEQLSFMDAHEAVIQETAVFVYRLPGIENLSFSDGMPFAAENTKEWLAGIAMDKGSGEGGYLAVSGDISGDSEESHIADVYKQAGALAKQKKLDEAVDLIQEQLRSGTSQKSRFLWRIALTRLLVNSRKARAALPHLSEILNDIKKYNLDNWDPDLALKALVEIYKGLRAQKDEISREQAVKTLDHMARLNPAVALRLME